VTTRHDEHVDLLSAYAYPTRAHRWVRGCMVGTVDGASRADGVSGSISGPADREIFATLRSLADLILVGSATARAENYGPAVLRPELAAARERAGRAEPPVIAVVTARLDLDLASPLFAETPSRTLIITGSDAPPDRLAAARASNEVIVTDPPSGGPHAGGVDIAVVIDELTSRGYHRILCEGGPRLLSQVAAARRLDELCLTISPQLRSGDAGRILNGPELPHPTRLLLHQLLVDDGFLFTRYLVTTDE
jgi:5-amino-6-(5-phosphoribosylamino)uracil reductase